jgi:hypothetical protein
MNYGSLPNYIPAYNGPKIIPAAQYEVLAAHEQWVGTVTEFQSQLVDADFVQPRQTWQTLGMTAGQQENFVGNVAAHLSGAVPQVRYNAYGMCPPEDTSFAWCFVKKEMFMLTWCFRIAVFTRIDSQLGDMVMKATEAVVTSKMSVKREVMPPKLKGRSFREYMNMKASM